MDFDFPGWLAEQLRKRDWTQLRLAQEIGISSSNITLYIYGGQIPNVRTFMEILKAFDMHMVLEDNLTK